MLMTERPPSAILSGVKSYPSTSLAIDRALALFETARAPAHPQLREGYLDLLGDEDPTGPHPGQRWMASRALPLIYERLWRPIGGRLLMGAMGPDMRGEHRIAMEMLSLTGGERVLDVGCGPGNFTRIFADAVDDGVGRRSRRIEDDAGARRTGD